MVRSLLLLLLVLSSGCTFLPQVAHQPTFHNPFPQLARVAVAPFFNLSSEPTVDGRQFALAYFNELQLVPGFEVVPVGVVESKMKEFHLSLDSARDARKLAQLLEVDAIVVGAVTDFSPYYPPRCGLRVEWYAANPCFHSIPPGYGLPLGTAQEEEIPGSLLFEVEMAKAQAQLRTQTPVPPPGSELLPLPVESELLPAPPSSNGSGQGQLLAFARPAGGRVARGTGAAAAPSNPGVQAAPESAGSKSLPAVMAPVCQESEEPVLRHTRTYNGHDLQFTQALREYAYFRDDARFGGWESYLERSDDFIRFCNHLHIAEMLTARGGAGETRVVWRWPNGR